MNRSFRDEKIRRNINGDGLGDVLKVCLIQPLTK